MSNSKQQINEDFFFNNFDVWKIIENKKNEMEKADNMKVDDVINYMKYNEFFWYEIENIYKDIFKYKKIYKKNIIFLIKSVYNNYDFSEYTLDFIIPKPDILNNQELMKRKKDVLIKLFFKLMKASFSIDVENNEPYIKKSILSFINNKRKHYKICKTKKIFNDSENCPNKFNSFDEYFKYIRKIKATNLFINDLCLKNYENEYKQQIENIKKIKDNRFISFPFCKWALMLRYYILV